MPKLRSCLAFVGVNFGPLVAFVLINRLFGVKAAIIAGLGLAAVGVLLLAVRRRRPTAFFAFSTVSLVVFGVIDLYQQTPFLIRYEAALTNCITGLYFLATVLVGKPVIQELAMQASPSPQPPTANRRFYFRFLTYVWTAYFFAKAAAYVWIARVLPFEEALALRAVIGQVSLVALLAGERVFRRKIIAQLARWNCLPEPRTSAQIAGASLA